MLSCLYIVTVTTDGPLKKCFMAFEVSFSQGSLAMIRRTFGSRVDKSKKKEMADKSSMLCAESIKNTTGPLET